MVDRDSEIDALIDAADRLERSLDVQDRIIAEIDTKAAHVTRLLGILLGLTFTVLSILPQADGMGLGDPDATVEMAFVVGISLLLLSMFAAIIVAIASHYPLDRTRPCDQRGTQLQSLLYHLFEQQVQDRVTLLSERI